MTTTQQARPALISTEVVEFATTLADNAMGIVDGDAIDCTWISVFCPYAAGKVWMTIRVSESGCEFHNHAQAGNLIDHLRFSGSHQDALDFLAHALGAHVVQQCRGGAR